MKCNNCGAIAPASRSQERRIQAQVGGEIAQLRADLDEAREIIPVLMTGEFYAYGKTKEEREAYDLMVADMLDRARAFLARTKKEGM